MLVVVTLVTVLSLAADPLARRIPFRYEQALIDSFAEAMPDPHPLDSELQSRADKIADTMNLREGMFITVHYVDE